MCMCMQYLCMRVCLYKCIYTYVHGWVCIVQLHYLTQF